MTDGQRPDADERTFEHTGLRGGQIAVTWLGQAGFLLFGADRSTFMIDPYLSDHAADSHGVRRIVPAPVAAERVTPDVILITHAHVDHLDPPTIRHYGRARTADLIAPPAVAQIARDELGWAGSCTELSAHDSIEVGGARVTATWTRHGYDGDALGPDAAVGYLIEIDGLALWHAGDTEYDARLHRFRPGDIDVALLPINGTGGNMNAAEAALLAWQLGVGVAVPMHFGMWSASDYTYAATEPWATLDPNAFVSAYRALAPGAEVRVPVVGKTMVFSARAAAGGA